MSNLRGAIAYQLTKRMVIDITTARAAVDAAFARSSPTDPEWIGCGECDVAFGCHGGKAKCLRTEGAPRPTLRKDTREHAEWLADKIVALGDYAKEAAEMLRRWPEPPSDRITFQEWVNQLDPASGFTIADVWDEQEMIQNESTWNEALKRGKL